MLTLTRAERLILSNQHRILALLEPKQEQEHERIIEVLENGYSSEYGDVAGYVREEVLSEEQCREVWDILDTFTALQRAYHHLEGDDQSGINPDRIKFWGFDGNHEVGYLGYTKFLRGQGKWEDLVPVGGLNSHGQFLGLYRTMVLRWKQSANPYDLTREDILRIIARE